MRGRCARAEAYCLARVPRVCVVALGCLLSVLIAGVGGLGSQLPTILYVYDDLGRLAKVIDSATSACAVYSYDAVGNILSISRRSDCAGPPAVTSLSPGPDENSFMAGGISLLGATVSFGLAGFSVSELRTTDDSLTVRFSTDRQFCTLRGSVTVATAFGQTQVPITLTGATVLPVDGQPVGESIGAVGETDRFCFELGAATQLVGQSTPVPGSFIEPCLEVRDAAGQLVAGGQGCAGFRG